MRFQEDTHQEDTMSINHIKYPSWVLKVKSLDYYQKMEIYINYYVSMLSLKHDFAFFDKYTSKNGLGKPDKEHLGLSFYFLWKEIKISTFDDFISENNIIIKDFGSDFKYNGFASQFSVSTYGIYDWYLKRKDEFCF